MKIYYSNMASIKFWDDFPLVGILISYYGLGNIKKPNYCDNLFLDSGAFSAFNKKTTIDLQKYIDFIKSNLSLLTIYASLDDITSYEVSLKNYQEMRRQGLTPLPAFHIGEPEWILDKYLENTQYVALGGVAKYSLDFRRRWFDSIFNKYPDSTKIGFHGFGIQDQETLMEYPWESVDASTAHVAARFGEIISPWGRLTINKSVIIANDRLNWVSNMSEDKIKEWISKFDYSNLDYDIACQQTVEGTMMRAGINIFYLESLNKETISKFTNKKLPGFGFGGIR